ncbi:MAG: YegP family protein [Streptosporangiaceae bacterium]
MTTGDIVVTAAFLPGHQSAGGFKGRYALSRGDDMAGKFVLKKGASGKFHFNLVASNGQVIATSEAYERKQSALEGIESVKHNAPDAAVDDQTED